MNNSFNTRDTLVIGDRSYEIFSLDRLAAMHDVARLPCSLKILLENLLRYEDGRTVTRSDIEALSNWDPKAEPDTRNRLPPRAGADAGFHRCAGGGRPGRHARCHARPWAAILPASTRCSRPNW